MQCDEEAVLLLCGCRANESCVGVGREEEEEGRRLLKETKEGTNR
jgi:hypothetical protein